MLKEQYENRFGFVLLFLVSTLAILPQFLSSQYAGCIENDAITHMVWIRQFSDALKEGVWIPKWLPNSMGGYGSPVFIFYSPLVYYFAAPVFWLSGSLTFTVKIVRFIGLFGSALAVWKCGRELADSKTSIAMAVIAVIVPYHILHSYYFSFVAETWAWIWLPLVIAGLIQILKGKANHRVLLALTGFYSLLILTHLISAYLCTAVLIAAAALCLTNPRTKSGSLYILGAMGLGLLSTAFFLLPALYEQRFVHIEATSMFPIFSYSNNFIFFPSPALDPVELNNLLALPLLRNMTSLCILWVLSAVILFISHRKKGEQLGRGWMFVFGLWLLSLFMTTRLSTLCWQYIPGMASIQFTSRWLLINAIAVSMLCGGVLLLRPRLLIHYLCCFFHLSLGVLLLLYSMTFIAKTCYEPYENEPACRELAHNVIEYVPLGLPNWQQIVQYPDPVLVDVKQGDALIRQARKQSNLKACTVESTAGCLIDLKTADYPGWKLYIDDQAKALEVYAGSIHARVPAGLHRIAIRFENTWWRIAAGWISLCMVLLLIGWTFLKKGRPVI